MNQTSPRSMLSPASAMGVSLLVALGLKGLSFLFYPLLTFSTFMILIGAILNLMAVWGTHRQSGLSPSSLHQWTHITGMAGSLIVLVGATNEFISSIVGHDLILWYPLSQSIVVLGYGVVGIWLIALNHKARIEGLWPSHLAWMGAVAGIIMATGLLAMPKIFIPAVALYHKPIPEVAELIGTMGWMLIYPLWSVWQGRATWKEPGGDLRQRTSMQ